jgi:hypothetical protein
MKSLFGDSKSDNFLKQITDNFHKMSQSRTLIQISPYLPEFRISRTFLEQIPTKQCNRKKNGYVKSCHLSDLALVLLPQKARVDMDSSLLV